jgi:hypothetical protein
MLTGLVLEKNNKYKKCYKLCDNKVLVSATATQERNSTYHWDYGKYSHVLSGLKILIYLYKFLKQTFYSID